MDEIIDDFHEKVDESEESSVKGEGDEHDRGICAGPTFFRRSEGDRDEDELRWWGSSSDGRTQEESQSKEVLQP